MFVLLMCLLHFLKKTLKMTIKYFNLIEKIIKQFIPIIFAVFINLLDAVTFGTCFFPSILGKTTSLAIDLFLFSTLIIQLILIFMSSFQYGLGTSMAENIPFIHTMTLGVYNSMKESYTVDEVYFSLSF